MNPRKAIFLGMLKDDLVTLEEEQPKDYLVGAVITVYPRNDLNYKGDFPWQNVPFYNSDCYILGTKSLGFFQKKGPTCKTGFKKEIPYELLCETISRN